MAKEYVTGSAKGRGGWRGGGHPFSENPKRKIVSLRLDTDVEDFVMSIENKSKFINGLIREAKDKQK